MKMLNQACTVMLLLVLAALVCICVHLKWLWKEYICVKKRAKNFTKQRQYYNNRWDRNLQ